MKYKNNQCNDAPSVFYLLYLLLFILNPLCTNIFYTGTQDRQKETWDFVALFFCYYLCKGNYKNLHATDDNISHPMIQCYIYRHSLGVNSFWSMYHLQFIDSPQGTEKQYTTSTQPAVTGYQKKSNRSKGLLFLVQLHRDEDTGPCNVFSASVNWIVRVSLVWLR